MIHNCTFCHAINFLLDGKFASPVAIGAFVAWYAHCASQLLNMQKFHVEAQHRKRAEMLLSSEHYYVIFGHSVSQLAHATYSTRTLEARISNLGIAIFLPTMAYPL